MIRIFIAALILAGAMTRVVAQAPPPVGPVHDSDGRPLYFDFSPPPPTRPWSSILVYSDKTYDLKEHIESEHACRESLCYVQWQVGCDEHQEKLKAEKRKAELQEIERQKQQVIYMQNHPCKIDAPSGQKICPTSENSTDIYDKDGKLLSSSWRGSGGENFIGGSIRYIEVAACFQ